MDLGGRTFVVDVSNGLAVPPTDSVLHSTSTKIPGVVIVPVTESTSPIQSSTPLSTSTSTSALNPGSVPSTSSAALASGRNSTASSRLPSSQISPIPSSGLRKTKNPWLLLAICCAGAMMYEMGVWTEKTKEEQAKAAEEEAKKKKLMDEAEKNCTKGEGEGSESAGKSKDDADGEAEAPAKESLNEWNMV